MADVNAGKPITLEIGSKVWFSTDGATWSEIRNVVGGTITPSIPGYEPKRHMEYGNLTYVMAGNERPCKLDVDICHTPIVEADGMLAKLMGALTTNAVKNVASDGQVYLFYMRVWIPDFRDAATGTLYVWSKCFLPDGFKIEPAKGVDFDVIKMPLESYTLSPAVTSAASP